MTPFINLYDMTLHEFTGKPHRNKMANPSVIFRAMEENNKQYMFAVNKIVLIQQNIFLSRVVDMVVVI